MTPLWINSSYINRYDTNGQILPSSKAENYYDDFTTNPLPLTGEYDPYSNEDFYINLLLMQIGQQHLLGLTNMHKTPNMKIDKGFDGAFQWILKAEGGYANVKGDKGGETNFGITHETYNSWCKENGLPLKSVKDITQKEVKNIYYNKYWLASGADKELDPKMAIALFDTAVLHGPSVAKKFYNQSGGDLGKFLSLRQDSYNKIVANDASQGIFKNGWSSRVETLKQLNVQS